MENLVDKEEIAEHITKETNSNLNTENQPLIKPITIQEMQLHLKKMKNKAPGEDNVDTILKTSLGQLCSTCLTTGHFTMESCNCHYDSQTQKRSIQYHKLPPHKVTSTISIKKKTATIAKVSQFADELCYWSSSKSQAPWQQNFIHP